MIKNKVTMLTEEQIFGINRTKIINEMGSKSAITDFAVILGAVPNMDFHVSYDDSLKGRTGCYAIISSDKHIKCVDAKGEMNWYSPYSSRHMGIRPVIPFSSIPINVINSWNGAKEIEYGEYPQYAESTLMLNHLDLESYYGKIVESGKVYTVNTQRWEDKPTDAFKPFEYKEYVYTENGRKFIKAIYIETKFRKTLWNNHTLSNGNTYGKYDVRYYNYRKKCDIILVRVMPIKWYVDYLEKIIISKNIILSGLGFNPSFEGNNYQDTEMNVYLNAYFAKDIVPSDVQKLVRKK